ncbi:MAG: hypothetical protein DWH78_06670 [Planctomycetota bacterium]|nr:MAG: hypothetical protein DWH78_06670 [Planctomycetota bacterium]
MTNIKNAWHHLAGVTTVPKWEPRGRRDKSSRTDFAKSLSVKDSSEHVRMKIHSLENSFA